MPSLIIPSREKTLSWRVLVNNTPGQLAIDYEDDHEHMTRQRIIVVCPMEFLATVNNPQLLANVGRQVFASECALHVG